MRLVDLEQHTGPLAEGVGRVFWPDTRGMEPFLTVTVGHYRLYIEGFGELNNLFKAFAPEPETHYLDI